MDARHGTLTTSDAMDYRPHPGVQIEDAIIEALGIANAGDVTVLLHHNYGPMVITRRTSFASAMAEWNRMSR